MIVNPKDHSTTKAKPTNLIVYFAIIILVGLTASLAGQKILNTHNKSNKEQERLLREELKDITTLEVATSYIKKKEGFKAAPYRCSAGAKTIGYGDTAYMREFPQAKSISEQEASTRLTLKVTELKSSLDEYSVQVGSKKITYAEGLEATQKAALISFIYNLGSSAYKDSALKEKIDQKLFIEAKLKKDYSKNPRYKDRLLKDLKYTNVLIQREFAKWSKIKSGKSYNKLNSLEERRREEARMFLAAS